MRRWDNGQILIERISPLSSKDFAGASSAKAFGWRVHSVQDEVDQDGQIVFPVKEDDGQQGIAGQREVPGNAHTAVTMAVFLPDAVVALVVVAVFHTLKTLGCGWVIGRKRPRDH
jgi:hypothetical protein